MSVEVVVGDFTEIEAHRWLREVNVAIADLVAAVAEGYMRRAWIPLGYASWAALCESDEFQLPRLSVEQRRSSVMALRDAGLSQRAIASAVGASKGTVHSDLESGAQNRAPEQEERVTGTDGKTYPSTRTETHDDEDRIVEPDPVDPFRGWSDDERELHARHERGETVVANQHIHGRLIRWAIDQDIYARIDRNSVWGNPFILHDDGDRGTVIAAYRDHYLPHKPSLNPRELKGKILGCWCSPLPCHGDVLVEASGS